MSSFDLLNNKTKKRENIETYAHNHIHNSFNHRIKEKHNNFMQKALVFHYFVIDVRLARPFSFLLA